MSSSSLAQGTGDEDDFLSLDFTKPVKSAPAPAPVVPPQPESRPELMLEPLDSPDLPKLPEQPGWTESFEPVVSSDISASTANPHDADRVAPVSLSSFSLEGTPSGSLVLQETFPVVRLDIVVEQVARAYADGHTDEALKILEEQLMGDLRDSRDAAAERLWWMLFDLYRVTGAQECFDRHALTYAEKFEKSPPAWNAQSVNASTTATASAMNTGGRASVTINGSLSARSAAQLEKLREVARTRSSLRIDVSKIKNVDQGGSQLLLDLVHALKNGTCELDLSGAEDLASLVKNKLVVGQRADEAMWLLLLELYQGLGLLDSFEETAVNYAVTFEVSPPSWIAPKRKGASALSEQMLASEVQRGTDDTLSLSGDLLDAGVGEFSAISHRLAHAHLAEPMTVDLARLRRIDEKSVMMLRQTLADVTEPRSVHLLNCSHLVAAMLEMAGIAKQAVVETTCL